MPQIKEYEAQVSAFGATVQTRRATAEDFGPTGGVEAVAAGLGDVGKHLKARAIEKDDTDFLSSLVGVKDNVRTRLKEAIESGDAAKPDWVQREHAYAQEQVDKAVSSLSTYEGQQFAKKRAAAFLSDQSSQWITTSSAVSASLQKNALQAFEDSTLRGIQQSPGSLQTELANFKDALDGPAYARLPKDVREDYARQVQQKAARASVDGVFEQLGPQEALNQLGRVKDDMTAEQYAALRDHYTIKMEREKAQSHEIAQDALYQQFDKVMRNGGNPEYLIAGGVKTSLLTAEQARGLRHEYQTYVDLQVKIKNADVAFRASDNVSFAEVEPKIRKQVADAWLAERVQEYTAASPEQKKDISNQIVKKGVRLDYVFDGLKHMLGSSPESPAFGTAVDTYRSLEAFDPYYASKYVSEDQRVRFDVYEQAIRGGATQEQALKFATNITPKAVAETKKVLRSPEGKVVVDNLRAKVSDAPGWGTGDMVNGRQATDAILARAEVMLAGNPSADVESIVSQARASYEKTNMQLGNMWVPKSFLDGVPDSEMKPVAERIVGRLPDVLRKNKLPVLDGSYVMAPDDHSPRDGRLQVFDPTGFPIPGLRFGPEDFKREYRTMAGEKYERAVKANAPEQRRKDIEFAMETAKNPPTMP